LPVNLKQNIPFYSFVNTDKRGLQLFLMFLFWLWSQMVWRIKLSQWIRTWQKAIFSIAF